MQVSQLFGSSAKRSKLANHSFGLLQTTSAKINAVVELTKVANAGYQPSHDIYEPFKDASKGVVPFDLDIPSRWDKPSVVKQALGLKRIIEKVLCRETPSQVPELAKIAIKNANFRLRRQLKKAFKGKI